MTDQEQLDFKTQRLIDKLKRIEDIKLQPIIPAPNKYHYRNKMEFSFFNKEDNSIGLGMHQKGQFNKFVDLETCLICPENNMEILKIVREWADANGLRAYNKNQFNGLLRYFIIRDSIEEKKKLIIIVTKGGDPTIFTELIEKFRSTINLAGFIWSNQQESSDAVLLNHWELVWGDDFLIEKLGHCTFKVPLNSFFQVNVEAAKILYDLIKSEINPGDNVLDLYCGAGTIGCYIADKAKSIFGIEVIAEAISSAHTNSELNNIKNTDFSAGKVRERLANITFDVQFDTVILDPPRSGTDKKTIARIAGLNPKTIVYVACGFENLAFNLTGLIDNGYEIVSTQPLDMFPVTPHVEVIVVLKKI